MTEFVTSNTPVLVLISFILSAASVVLFLVLYMAIREMKRPYGKMAELFKGQGSERALEELFKGIDENRDYIRNNADEIKRIVSKLNTCYRGAGLVRFNAFDDVGGMQSYSLCIINQEKNGYMLTNLVGRDSSRGYTVEINGGNPSRELSDEEEGALSQALSAVGDND
jgi:hypothetical protein